MERTELLRQLTPRVGHNCYAVRKVEK
jgi:hypothetical protein